MYKGDNMEEIKKILVECAVCSQKNYLILSFLDGEFVWLCATHYDKYIKNR
jgi:hypothetical protein